MAASLTRIVATAYACTATGDAPALDVIPGLDGSGLEPVLSVPLRAGGSDADELLAANGWRTVVVATAGQLRQVSPWTDAGDYAVATVVPAGADTTCDRCGRDGRWVLTGDAEVVCGCSLQD